MGQKVSPIGFRVGINKPWDSSWYASKEDFAKFLLEDNKIRKFFQKNYAQAAVAKVNIERTKERLVINVYTGRPAVLIGQKGSNIEVIKKQLSKIINPTKNLVINVKEVKKPDLDANLVAESIANQLEKRVAYKRCLKQAQSSLALVHALDYFVNREDREKVLNKASSKGLSIIQAAKILHVLPDSVLDDVLDPKHLINREAVESMLKRHTAILK